MSRETFKNAVWSSVSQAHPTMDLRKACVPTALTCVQLGKKFGYDFRFQAGTALWTPKKGVSFGYTWRGVDYPPNKKHMSKGELPEVHAWVRCIKSNIIVDLTTRYWVDLYTEITSEVWEEPDPPNFLWAKADKLPAGVTYTSHADAIKTVLKIIHAL